MNHLIWWIFGPLAFIVSTFAQTVEDPARINAYVEPFYDSKGPKVVVGEFSKGLAANNEAEFVSTLAKMKQSWNDLKFPQLYVAAIRLYDNGFRNEATYWFYSAQYRARLFAALINKEKMGSVGAPGFELLHAGQAFQQLVGNYINGYAYGDLDKLRGIVTRVQQENKVVPDLTKIYPTVAFQPKGQWDAVNSAINDGLTKYLDYLKQQQATISKTRLDNGTQAKFGNLTSKELPK
jgi:hypothetical protein